MATIANPSPPISLQIRFGRRCRQSSLLPFKIRFRPPIRRLRLVSASGSGGRSWRSNSASPDSFSGWSENGEDGDPKKKDGLGGMLGAGLAGVFFVAGVTFASISLSSRTTSSGAKQQMEPLTTTQEITLTSDDLGEKVLEVGKESNLALPDNGCKTIDSNSESGTGINKDLFPCIGSIKDATGSGLDNFHLSENSLIQNMKSNENGFTTIQRTSIQQSLDVDRNLASSSQNPSLTELSANDAVEFPSDNSSFKDTHNNMISDSPDSFIGIGEKDAVNDVNLSSMSTDSTVHTSDSLHDSLRHEDFPLEFASKPIIESRDNAASVIKDENMEHNDMLQLELAAEASSLDQEVQNVVRIVPSNIIPHSDFDQNEASTLPKEYVKPSEGHILDDSVQSITYFGSNGNEHFISGHNIGRRSISESVPEKSVSYAGVPAPSLVPAALQAIPGKVVVPAVVDQVQGQTLAALQVLKVVEADVRPGDLCTRREYARWLVSASSALSRSTISKVHPAMYIENVTELAFDDVTPEDPDFSSIQGLAEAGIISSKLSSSDFHGSSSGQHISFPFSPESPVSRQDLVSWKMALETRPLPEVDRKNLYQRSGYIDIDKIDPNVWPALVADLSAGEQGIIALAFGYTRLFQPNKPVTKAQAAIALANGDAADVVGEELTRIEAESLAETAVNAHAALVSQVEEDLNVSYEKDLSKEREKINAIEKFAEEARLELERLRTEREEENNALVRGTSAVESEMEVLSKLRRDVEDQLQGLMNSKLQISFEKDTIKKLRKEAESENRVIVQLQYELEVERKAMAMARSWAEEEAKRAREQARALEEARERWERHGIKVIVDGDLQNDSSTGKKSPVYETVNRAESLVEKLKAMAAEIKLRSSVVIERIIQKIVALVSLLKQHASETSDRAKEYYSSVVSSTSSSMEELKENTSGFNSSIGERARRVVADCKGSVNRFSQKFKA